MIEEPGLFVELGDDGEPLLGEPLMPPRSDELPLVLSSPVTSRSERELPEPLLDLSPTLPPLELGLLGDP